MGSTTPLARAVRTFAQSETGVLVAAVGADWIGGSRSSAVALALGTVAALVAAIAAFLLAVGGAAAVTPIGKAIASAAQFAGAGLVTVGLADVTGAAAVDFGKMILRVVVAAVLTGLVTFAQNTAEQATPTASPAPPA